MVNRSCSFRAAAALLLLPAFVTPFGITSTLKGYDRHAVSVLSERDTRSDADNDYDALSRRDVLSVAGGLIGGCCINALPAKADDSSESFASIAARASQMSKVVEEKQVNEGITAKETASKYFDSRTVYDFTVPFEGNDIPFGELIHQERYVEKGEDGEVVNESVKVKAILVLNMKQDDPFARKDIPELISLAALYGRKGEFAVVMSPTDQGYFEADTSQLIRLKLASEYGYGINPATSATDKMNILGSGCHPFWRYIEGQCRTPSGIGRIEGNFEKFLIDGRTGRPVRRYPRKYMPFDIKDDIESLIAGKPLSPAGANWKEQWRESEKDSEKDVYRFQKGLNYYDQ